jgi:DNA-binding MarR family transcriptional regulator
MKGLAVGIDIRGALLVWLIDQLEVAGLVQRRVDAQDRRAMFEGIDDRDLEMANDVLRRSAIRAVERWEHRG